MQIKMEKKRIDNVSEVFERLRKQKNFIYEIKGKLYFHIGHFMRECSSEEMEQYKKYQEFFRQFDDAYYRKQPVEVFKYLLYDYQLEELYNILDKIGNGTREDTILNAVDMIRIEEQEYSDDEINNIEHQVYLFAQADDLRNRWLAKMNKHE